VDTPYTPRAFDLRRLTKPESRAQFLDSAAENNPRPKKNWLFFIPTSYHWQTSTYTAPHAPFGHRTLNHTTDKAEPAVSIFGFTSQTRPHAISPTQCPLCQFHSNPHRHVPSTLPPCLFNGRRYQARWSISSIWAETPPTPLDLSNLHPTTSMCISHLPPDSLYTPGLLFSMPCDTERVRLYTPFGVKSSAPTSISASRLPQPHLRI